jgi:flavodoxin
LKVAIRYYSRSGNTERLARTIGAQLGEIAQKTEKPLTEPVDILFVGGGLYAGKLHKNLRSYLASLDPSIVKEVVCFSTAATDTPIVERVREILAPLGIVVSDRFFHCKGKFLLTNKGRPNHEDLKAAGVFARNVVDSKQEK